MPEPGGDWEWVNEAEERRREFGVVCTGNGAHIERTLAAFPVSRTWGLIAPVPGPEHLVRAEFAPRSPRASYGVLSDADHNVTRRWFHCRQCGTPYDFPEAAFRVFIEMLQEEAGGDLAGRRLDLSVSPARLL